MKQTKICCEELKEAVADGDLRYNKHKSICLGTIPIWYCPFCGEEICWVHK